MNITKFEGCNVTYAENQDQYEPLPAHRTNDDYGVATSCWTLTFRELLRVIFTRRIYAKIMTFNQPILPLKLTTEKEIDDE